MPNTATSQPQADTKEQVDTTSAGIKESIKSASLPFMDGAKDFIKNPLGIIGLFIVLVYAVATIVIGSAMDRAHGDWREPFTWFIVAFPVVMLFVFRDLVVNHHAKLYAPADFPNSADFILLARDKVREALTEYNGQGANGVRAPLATDQVKARLDESIRVLENLLTKTQRRQ